MTDFEKTDVLIIGGGAAGMAAAVNLKLLNKNISVTVAESESRVLKKLLLTGNGRCNITNKNVTFDRYHGENVHFCEYALNKYPNTYTEEFFAKLGVLIKYEENGKAFPFSFQASSVVDALRFKADELGVKTECECRIERIEKEGKFFKVYSKKKNFSSQNIIVATGLLSGGKSVGNNGDGEKLLKNLGVNFSRLTPSIVQLKTERETVKALKGIKVNANVSLFIDGKLSKVDYGEVLFCDYGLSGPPVLQVSRDATRTDEIAEISLDLLKEFSFEELLEVLKSRRKLLCNRPAKSLFYGFINRILGETLIKNSGVDLNKEISALRDAELKKIVSVCKNFRFTVIGDNGFNNSQVTAGGAKTEQFNDKTMESKSVKGLYCVGEILDIDGDCGGYNLQWAWSSAAAASKDIAEKLQQ